MHPPTILHHCNTIIHLTQHHLLALISSLRTNILWRGDRSQSVPYRVLEGQLWPCSIGVSLGAVSPRGKNRGLLILMLLIANLPPFHAAREEDVAVSVAC